MTSFRSKRRQFLAVSTFAVVWKLLQMPQLSPNLLKFLCRCLKIFFQFAQISVQVPQFFFQFAQIFVQVTQFFFQFAQIFVQVPQFFFQFVQIFVQVPQFFFQFAQFFVQVPQNGGKQPEAESRLRSGAKSSHGKSWGNWQWKTLNGNHLLKFFILLQPIFYLLQPIFICYNHIFICYKTIF